MSRVDLLGIIALGCLAAAGIAAMEDNDTAALRFGGVGLFALGTTLVVATVWPPKR